MSHFHLFNYMGFVLFCQIFNLQVLNKIFAYSKKILLFTDLKTNSFIDNENYKFLATMWAKQLARIKAVLVLWLSLEFIFTKTINFTYLFSETWQSFSNFLPFQPNYTLVFNPFRPKIGFPSCLCSCTVYRKRKKWGNLKFSNMPMNKGFFTYSFHRVNIPVTYSRFDTR